MSKIIEVRGLSKSYIINHEGKEQYTALRDVIARKAKKIFSFPGWKPSSSITKEEFWALKDIDFDIEQGDRVGIIGRNGAGNLVENIVKNYRSHYWDHQHKRQNCFIA